MRAAFAPTPPARLGVAVSGGGDSVALLHLLADWARNGGPELKVVTVDHMLRPESTTEAEGVAAMCQRLGIEHQTLCWQDWDGQGNLMDAARRARMRLIADWARAHGIGRVALGHTLDDQAETFVMRLARGSGVDGLAAMAHRREALGVMWDRPLIDMRRAELRDFLAARGEGWVDDPTNEDAGYDRIKARQALAVLGPLGITPDRIADTVFLMSLARLALQGAAARLAADHGREDAGGIIVERQALIFAPYETSLRFLAEAIRWVSSSDYRPRLEALMEVHSDLLLQRTRTLSGCLMTGDETHVRIVREPKAVATVACPPHHLWDNRWRVEGPVEPGLEVRALTPAGLRTCKDWRETGIERDALVVSPAIWRGDVLVAAPIAGFSNGWTARIDAGFASFIISH